MRSYVRKLAVVGVLATTAACSDSGMILQDAPGAEARRIQSAAAAAPFVARALAMAMSDAEVQETVKDAMRASRVVEHKLVLQEFLGGEGHSLLVAAARASGVGEAEMARIVGLLPEMDFYVPERESRLEWRVGAPMAVGITLDQNAQPVQAFRTTGATFKYGEDRGVAFFFMEPAEPKGRRVHAQPLTDGPVIQDPNDGEISLTVTTVDAAGNEHVVDFADFPMAFRAPVVHRSNPNGLPGDWSLRANHAGERGTYLNVVQPFFADGVGACEPYTKNYYKADKNSSTITEYTRTSWGGMPCDQYGSYIWDFYNGYPPYGYFLLHNVLVGFDDKVAIQLWEDDSFSDDNYGWFDFFYNTRDDHASNAHAIMGIATAY